MAPKSHVKEQVELSGKSLIDTLRKAVKPPGKKGLWLQYLNDKQLLEIYHRLKMAQPIDFICRMVRDDWKIMRHLNHKSLIYGIKTFRTRTLPILAIKKSRKADKLTKEDRKVRHRIKAQAKRVIDKLDGMKSLQWLIMNESERYEIFKKIEEDHGIASKHVSTIAERLHKMLDDLVGRQIQLGMLDAKPSEYNVIIKQQFDAMIQTVDGGGQAITDAAHKFFELAEGRVVELHKTDEGKFEKAAEGKLLEVGNATVSKKRSQ